MTGPRSKHVRGFFRHGLTLGLILLSCRAARADVVTLADTSAPIVRITLRSGDVTVRTWNRPAVEIDGDPSLSIERRTMHQPAEAAPLLIPHAQQNSREGPVSLPAESFVVSTIPSGPHDAIVIKSGAETPSGPVTVTIPADAAYVFAFARDGNLDVRGYRGGTLMAFTTHGRLALEDVGGTVFAQSYRGAVRVADSSFDRVRARSLFGNISFERCRTRQIEATSVAGSIVYDSGSFDPGLAHFESTRGDVAIGTQGAVQFGGHVGAYGRVYTNFERGARVSGNDGDTEAVVGGGGPIVTATTQSGNVYLYDGTIHSRERLSAPWSAPISSLSRPGFRRVIPPRTYPTRRPREQKRLR